MARNSSVTYNAVRDACVSLLSSGQNPSFPLVYEIIGRKGSAKVVQDFINQWRLECADAFNAKRESPILSSALTALADNLVQGLYEAAQKEANEVLADELADLAAEKAEVAKKDKARDLAVADAQEDAYITRTALAGAEATVAQQQEQISALTAMLLSRDAEMTALREQLERLATAVDQERQQRIADLDAERTRHEAEIAREREVAQGERRHLMLQTDEVRQSARKKEVELQKEIDDCKTTEGMYRQRANKAEDQAGYWRGRADAAEAAAVTHKEIKPAANPRHRPLTSKSKPLRKK